MLSSPLILVIDDEQAILDILHDSLSDEEFRVETLSQPEKALETIGALIPDLILLDIFMPNVNGIDLLEKIKKEYPEQKVIMISGFGTIATALEAVNKGAISFIEKPLNLDEILDKISFLKQTTDEVFHPKTEHSNDFIGESYLFRELINSISCVAKLNLPILIYGHHGTGKTAAALYIHSIKNKPDELFVTIDCSSTCPSFLSQRQILPDETIYFKNINNLSLDQQKTVLQFIQTKDDSVSIIASSTQQLFQLHKEGLFIGTLFYELNAIPLEIPVLNKRRHDIPLLVDYFLKKNNSKNNRQQVLSISSIRLLRNANWPGNIRQLKKLITVILQALPNKQVLLPEDFYPFLDERTTQLVEEQSFTQFNTLEEAKISFEKSFLLYHLKRSNFDLSQVSDKLHLNIPQLRARMQELKITVTN